MKSENESGVLSVVIGERSNCASEGSMKYNLEQLESTNTG